MKRTIRAVALVGLAAAAAGCGEAPAPPAAVESVIPADSSSPGLRVGTTAPVDTFPMVPDSPALGADSVLLRQ